MGKKLSFEELKGIKYGLLTILSESDIKINNRATAKCICDCGNVFNVSLNNLRIGNTNSCGCIRLKKPNNLTHNLRKHPIYSVWANVKQRCFNEKFIKYSDYGGRGIGIDENWKNDFKSFYNWCLQNGYKKGLEIDRIDNNGNYEPSNCRFSSRSENMNNTRHNTIIEYKGEIKTLAQWSIELDIPYGRLAQRINKLKMPADIAFSKDKIKRRFHKK